jgi:ketosteroid isomerase-like protein
LSNEQNPSEVVNWSTDRVDIASSGDMAVEFGKFESKNAGLNGKESDKGTYVTVFRKEKGKWKVTADFVNSTKPQAVSRE